MAVLRNSQGFWKGLFDSPGNVTEAAETFLRLSAQDRLGDNLLDRYLANPAHLNEVETVKLAELLENYAATEGPDKARALLKHGSYGKVQPSDVGQLYGYAQGVLAGRNQHAWQSSAGEGGIMVLSGGLGTSVRVLGALGTIQNTVDAAKMIQQGDSTGYGIIGLNILGAGMGGRLASIAPLRGEARLARIRGVDTTPPTTAPVTKLDPVRRVVDYGAHAVTKVRPGEVGGSPYTMEGMGKRLGIGAAKTADVPSGATNPSVNGPIFNPAGKVRAEKFTDFQQGASLQGTIARIAGDNPVVTYTASGKTLYTNPVTGQRVVYDNAGNCFRV